MRSSTEHYFECRDIYSRFKENHVTDASISLSKFDLSTDLIEHTDEYAQAVKDFSSKASISFESSKTTTNYVKHVLNPLKVSGIKRVVDLIVPQLEQKLFNSYAHVSEVYLYRYMPVKFPAHQTHTWNCGSGIKEIVNVLIYLQNVGINKDNGPMEYMATSLGKPLLINDDRYQDRWHLTNADMKLYYHAGFYDKRIIGDIGQTTVFSDLLLRHARPAIKRRDSLLIQVRPSTFEMKPKLSPSWTGGLRNQPFSNDPYEIRPIKNDMKLPMP